VTKQILFVQNMYFVGVLLIILGTICLMNRSNKDSIWINQCSQNITLKSNHTPFNILLMNSWEHLHHRSVCDTTLGNLGWGSLVKSSESAGRLFLLTRTLKRWTAFRALEEPWNSLINTGKSCLLTAPCFWLAT